MGTENGLQITDASLIQIYDRGIITREEAELHMRNPQALIDAMTKPGNNTKGESLTRKFLSGRS